MSAGHTPGPLVCWQRDGTPLIVRPLTDADRVLNELQHSADMLAEATSALRDHADNIEWRDEGAAHELRRLSDRVMQQQRDATTAIAKATGAAS